MTFASQRESDEAQRELAENYDRTTKTLNEEVFPPLTPAGRAGLQLEMTRWAGTSAGRAAILAAINGATTTAQLLISGDSHADGYLLPDPATQKWPAVLLADLPVGQFGPLLSTATAGETLVQQRNRLAGMLAQINPTTYSVSVVVVEAGSNDISTGATVAQVRQRRIDLIADIRAYAATLSGHRVAVILTSIARNGKENQGVSREDFEAMRTELNTEAFTAYTSLYDADYYLNYDSSPELYDPYNETYYHPDRQHINVAGNEVEAELIRPVVLAAVADTPLAPLANYVPGGSEELLATYQESDFAVTGTNWQRNLSLNGTTLDFTNNPGDTATLAPAAGGKQIKLYHGDYSGNTYFASYEVWINGALDGAVNMPVGGANEVVLRYTSQVYPAGITSIELKCTGFLPVDRLEVYA